MGRVVARVYERFLCFTAVESLTGDSLAAVILRELHSAGLRLDHLIGLGFDGAANMSGHIRGVQARIREQVPWALYTHCASHSLNLAIVSAIDLLSGAATQIQAVISFINGSPARRNKLRDIVNELNFSPSISQATKVRLLKLCDTRWVERHVAFTRFRELFQAILVFLETMISSDKDPVARGKAEAYYNFLARGETVMKVGILSHLSNLLIPVSSQLQTVNMDLLACLQKIRVVKGQVKDAYSPVQPTALLPNPDPFPSYSAIFDDAAAISAASGFDLKCPRGTPAHLNNPKKFYLEKFWRPVYMKLEQQLELRFSKHHEMVFDLSGLVPSMMAKVTPQRLEAAVATYQDVLKGPSREEVRIALGEWLYFWQQGDGAAVVPQPTTALETLEITDPDLFPLCYRLVHFLSTLACTTASVERSFSTLGRIKTHIRASMGESRLNGLGHMSINRDLEVNISEVIKGFESLAVRNRSM